MNVSRELFPQQEILNQRCDKSKGKIAESLSDSCARPVVVAVCQVHNHCGGEEGKCANINRMLSCIEQAAHEGSQIVIFPEMFLPGYFVKDHGTPEEAVKANHSLADEVGHSLYLKHIQETCTRCHMVLAFGFCEKKGDAFYNAVGVVDADGTWLGSRHKNPLSPGPYDLKSFTQPPISERCSVFKTQYATVGVSCCFDGEFPESIRRMRMAGAELLLWCNGATGEPKMGHSCRFSACGSHAQVNRIWVASVNSVGGTFYGNSCIYAPWGEPLVQLNSTDETLGVATVNLALSDDWSLWYNNMELDMYRCMG